MTNTGNVDLVSVVVDDPLVAACDNNIGNLAEGAMVTYECEVTDVQQLIDNEALVEAFFEDVKVEDSDKAFLGIIAASAAIGDTVWLDEDKDGIEDAGEPGVPNADVLLYLCTDLATDPDCSDERILIDTTTTDGDGHYEFINLEVGDYLSTVDTSTVSGPLTTPGEFLVPLGSGDEFLNADFGIEEVLPETGIDSDRIGWFGLVLLAMGGMLILGAGLRGREEE